MARFDLYLNETGSEKDGYLVAVQSDWLSHLNTTMVIPAFPIADAPAHFQHLNPIIEINGDQCSLHPEIMGTVDNYELQKKVMNIAEEQDKISSALDMLFHGF